MIFENSIICAYCTKFKCFVMIPQNFLAFIFKFLGKFIPVCKYLDFISSSPLPLLLLLLPLSLLLFLLPLLLLFYCW